MESTVGNGTPPSTKVVFVGDSETGKSSAIKAFAAHVSAITGTQQRGEPEEVISDIHGSDYVNGMHCVYLDLGSGAEAVFWECSVKAASSSLSTIVFGANCVVITYDICNYGSYHSALTSWTEQLRSCGYSGPLLLLGCKMDLVSKREVHSEEAGKSASRFNMGFMEMSSTKSTNSRHAFRLIMNLAKSKEASTAMGRSATAKADSAPTFDSLSSKSAASMPLAPAASVAAAAPLIPTALEVNFMDSSGSVHKSPSSTVGSSRHSSRHRSPRDLVVEEGGKVLMESPTLDAKPKLMRKFDHTVQISSSYDSIDAILGRKRTFNNHASPLLSLTSSRTATDPSMDAKVEEEKKKSTPSKRVALQQAQQATSKSLHMQQIHHSAKSTPSPSASSNIGASPPRALFAQEYEKMVRLFEECGVEATDGFLSHMKEMKQGDVKFPASEKKTEPLQDSAPTISPSKSSRLQSITPMDYQSIREAVKESKSKIDAQQQPKSKPNQVTQKLHGASQPYLSVSPSTISRVSPLLQSKTKNSGSKQRRVWGQHIVPGSAEDMSVVERLKSIKLKDKNRHHVREVSEGAEGTGEEGLSNGADGLSGRVPDFFLDVDIPGGGKAKLAVRMDARPRELAEIFVNSHPGLRKRMIPILTDKIKERMDKFREQKRRKKYAMLHRRRRNMLAPWKTSKGNQASSYRKDSHQRDQKSEHSRPRQQEWPKHGKHASHTNRQVIAKLHVQVSADTKRTINIRKGDRAEDLARNFCNKYGLKQRDQDIVCKRLQQEIDQLGRSVGPTQYSRGSRSANDKFEVPSNLTQAQKNLLIKTMRGGVAPPTPWKEPSTSTPTREEEHQVARLRMKITLPSGGTDRLVVMEGDDLLSLARNFVAKHSLSDEGVSSLYNLLQSELARKEKRMKKT